MSTGISHQKKIQHLFWRAGFGANTRELLACYKRSIPEIVDAMFEDAAEFTPFNTMNEHNFPLRLEKAIREAPNQEKKKALRVKAHIMHAQLNVDWIEQMGLGYGQLREKMALFWHNHFACFNANPYRMQLQINKIRKHALGNFGDLLKEVSKDSAMLLFLGNAMNVKGKPNENFARELLELFTLGIGHYTEKDIQEAARALTGWSFDEHSQFKDRPHKHDKRKKTFLGQTGNWNGDDIIRIVLEQKQTAYFITEKLYHFLVNKKVRKKRLMALANFFYQSNYDITALLKKILSAEWFYNAENIGTKMKSPIELLAGLMHTFEIDFHDKKTALHVQKVLGQELMKPPNVKGWPSGEDWIDITTLAFRLNLPRYLFSRGKIHSIPVKQLSNEGQELILDPKKKQIPLTYNFQKFKELLIRLGKERSAEMTADFLLQPDTSHLTSFIKRKQGAFNRGKLNEQSLAVTFLSLPEYQLC